MIRPIYIPLTKPSPEGERIISTVQNIFDYIRSLNGVSALKDFGTFVEGRSQSGHIKK